MFEVRPAANAEEYADAIYGIGQYFGPPLDEARIERFAKVLPFERMHAAWEDGRVVGGAGAFAFDLSVPGGVLPCAGVTVVGVYPTHRRRGALRAMMDEQLRSVHERGEPIAALWASEETIYGRFGYGLAAWCGEIKLPREWAAFARPFERRGSTRLVSAEDAATLFPPIWTSLMERRTGVFQRTKDWWELRRLRMPDEEAANPKRFVVLELDGEPQAYAIYRQFPSWAEGSTTARLEVSEVVAATPEAEAEMWRYVLDIDWYATLESYLLPPDHPLFLLLANPRRMKFRMGDSLWVRVVDVGAALSGRAYTGDGSVVFEVRDAVCSWNDGRWKLEGGSAERTDAAAELALDVEALGSAYLGAVSFAQLEAAGRVEELVDGAVGRADSLFGWRPLPWCPEIF
jgi:predicted acetyltransferase